jgi:hypothetical protein
MPFQNQNSTVKVVGYIDILVLESKVQTYWMMKYQNDFKMVNGFWALIQVS